MTVLDRVPVDQITAEARQVDAGRVVLSMIAAVFFAVGWTAGTAVTAAAWCCLAVKAGWLEARPRHTEAAGRS
ncbi:hypothetical protein [Actinokineospora sp.]|uniref:hypothetical protein n=1 Tax=Actinokineospora sp. TaxID=1872133 RepID=UPI003D6B284A